MSPLPWMANVGSMVAWPALALFGLWLINRSITAKPSEEPATDGTEPAATTASEVSGDVEPSATATVEVTGDAESPRPAEAPSDMEPSATAAATIPSSPPSVIQFAGDQDSIAISNLHYETAGVIGAITLEAWVKTDSEKPQIIASWDRNEYWRLGIGENRLVTRRRVLWATTDEQGTVHDMLGTIQIADGQWHFVGVTYDAATGIKRIYVDGQLDTQSAAHNRRRLGTGTPRYGFLGVGSAADQFDAQKAPRYYLQGALAEMRIWNTALTLQESQGRMRHRLTGQEAGLVGYWPLDRIEERNGIPIVLDLTPQQNHGHVNGATVVQDADLPIAGEVTEAGG